MNVPGIYIINIRTYVHVKHYAFIIYTITMNCDINENGAARPHHLRCVDRTGTNFKVDYIALGPVPALDGPAYLYHLKYEVTGCHHHRY